MITNYIRHANKAILGLAFVLTVALFSLNQTAPVKANADVFGDGCTTANTLTRYLQSNVGIKTGQLDMFRSGLMNARVYSPIIDWDVSYSHMNYGVFSGYKPVDYLTRFGFTNIPFPNEIWVHRYFSDRTYSGDGMTQVEYDARAAQALASSVVGGGAFGKVSNRSKFVANPILYQQATVLSPSGMPYFPAIQSAIGGNQIIDDAIDQTQGGAFDAMLGPSNIPSSIDLGIFGSIDTSMLRLADQVRRSPGGAGSIFTLMQQLTSIVLNTDTPNGNAGGLIGDMINPSDGEPLLAALVEDIGPVASFAGVAVNVDTNSSAPNTGRICNLGDGTMAPVYAFNNPISGFRFEIPGTIYSIFTQLFGRGKSYDGITIYSPSKNGNYMLDCYGRGETPTLNLLTGQTFGSRFALLNALLPIVGIVIPPAAAIWGAVRNLPWPELGTMYYGLGMGFAFIMDPSSARLPHNLRYRAIDWTASGQELIKIAKPDTSGSDTSHGNSLNGYGQDFPFRLKLKEPYKLSTSFEGGAVTREEDGTELQIDININKSGYNKGHDSSGYREAPNRSGGPTNDRLQWQPRVKIARMITEPGSELNELINHQYGGSHTDSSRLDLQPGVDYIEGNNLCDFMLGKVNGPDSDARECDYIEPDTGPAIGMAASERQLTIKDVRDRIPAETEPGTKYCYAVYTDMFSNDIKYDGEDYWDSAPNNRDFSSPRDKRLLSRTFCVISGYKPSFQVRGGDLISGGMVDTETNTKEYLASPGSMRTYGSWVEYGVIASGPIDKLASGAGYRVGMLDGANPNPPEGTDPPHETELEVRTNNGPLSFSNSRSADNSSSAHGNFGEVTDGFGEIVEQFVEAAGAGDMVASSDVDVADLDSGVHLLRASTTLHASRKIDDSKSIILLAPDNSNIRITGNIELKDTYPSEKELSQVVIAPLRTDAEFNVDIEPNVSRVDSWILNPNGQINTCYINPADSDTEDQTPRGYDWPCYNTLTVNGPVSVDTLLLRRSGSRDQNEVPNYQPLLQSVAGENFNLRPDAYIWAANYVSDFGRKLVTTNLLDLPPRL